MLMHHGVAAAAGDQPSVCRKSRDAGNRERAGKADPEQRRGQRCAHRAGNQQHDGVVDDLMMVMEIVSAANESLVAATTVKPARSNGSIIRA